MLFTKCYRFFWTAMSHTKPAIGSKGQPEENLYQQEVELYKPALQNGFLEELELKPES